MTLLGSDILKDVFKAVVKDREILFRDLRKAQTHIAPDELKASLDQLKAADLIKEYPASIQDFSTYYVTAGGLNAELELKRAESALIRP